MPATDKCEPQMVSAFQKDGWQVVQKHYAIRLGKRRGAVLADLKLEKDAEAILIVEIKCFERRRSIMDEFYHALGQYRVYEIAMELEAVLEPLYLAIPLHALNNLILHEAVQETINRAKMKMIIVDLALEEIVQWYH